MFQHLEYFPFGETFVEEHSNTQRAPYLFTGKELDEDTGLYYYGARYYDPRTSLWQSADPILTKYLPEAGKQIGLNAPSLLNNYGSPRHQLVGMGGVYTGQNLNLYHYSGQNPVRYTDPDGRYFKEPVITVATIDATTPDPSDGFMPKWAAWGVVIALATAADYVIIDQLTKTNTAEDNDGILIFFHGTTSYEGEEVVQSQAFNKGKIVSGQQSIGREEDRMGLYLTSQSKTADYYADLKGGAGEKGGPSRLRVLVPEKDFKNLMARHGIKYEAPVPQAPTPGQTETLIPPAAIDEFNAMMVVGQDY